MINIDHKNSKERECFFLCLYFYILIVEPNWRRTACVEVKRVTRCEFEVEMT